jgi:hypothetical protein
MAYKKAAATPMKRKATFAARSAKKSRKDKGTGKQVSTVVNAISHAESLPANLRSLLKSVLPVVLNANKVDRHAFEAEVVDQAQQALAAVQSSMERQHADAVTTQNAVIAPAENAKRTSAKKQADESLEAAKAKLEGDKAVSKAAEKAVDEADDVVKAAQKEEKAADKELQKRVAKKDSVSGVLANEFTMLKDGTAGAGVGKAVQKILAIGKEYGVDSTLLHTLPLACKTPVAIRTEFQSMMFTNLQTIIEKQIGVLAENVAEAEPVKAAKEAAVASAKDAFEQAKAASVAADATLAAAQTAHKDAGKEVHRAEAQRRRIWEDMRHACDTQDNLANDLKNLKENVWAVFNQLKEKEPDPEPVEEPEPAEEVAAPAEAAEPEA